MPVLADKFFRGGGNIPSERISSLATKGDSDAITRTLTRLGWEGNLIAGVLLHLSVDGRTEANSEFFLGGKLAKAAISVQASKIWKNAAKDIALQFECPPGATFNFSNGGLVSNYYLSNKTV